VFNEFSNAAPSPPIQEWPTNALGIRPSRPSTPLKERTRSVSTETADGPSPGHDGITPPDKKTLRKIRSFERRAEATRKAKAMAPADKPKRKPAAAAGTKRKMRHSLEKVAVTHAPPLRPSYTSPYIPQGTYGYLPTPTMPTPQPIAHGMPSPSGYGPYGNPYAIHPSDPRYLHQPHKYGQPHQSQPTTYGQSHPPQVHGGIQPYNHRSVPTHNLSQGPSSAIDNPAHLHHDPMAATFQNDYMNAMRRLSRTDYQQNMPTTTDMSRQQIMRPKTPSPEPIDYDSLPQLITTTYSEYKYSVIHYTLSADSSYTFAQSFLSDLFTMNLPSPQYKWTTHSTPGFISNGTCGSFIILHNASDPFERGIPPINTTSVGTYGLAHNEIHWITYAPGIKWLLEWCEKNGGIAQKGKWTWNMAKASEKRFHRAYWMAATMGTMGGLLNRGDVRDEDDMFGVIENYEEEWDVIEQDLQGANDWAVSVDEAELTWKEVVKFAEERDGIGLDHVITASSEWESISSE
jgi:hypothetical protein